ncbi:hypothetical protein ONS96_007546 [Cadophora gregata f. sp. sojae]|nr:hypothetical protein ONS96_007546 [Cadophora gregata f. sp. sojae]
MAGIYMESCLTLAATASIDSDGGFFFNRYTRQSGVRTTSMKTFEFQRTFGGVECTLYVRSALESGHLSIAEAPWLPKFPTHTTPLLHRAWAYQERMLAPRTLHVNTDEMLWECKECTLCECGSLAWYREQSNPEHLGHEKPFAIESISTLKGKVARVMSLDKSFAEVHMAWQQIVKQYTMLKLTKESDRLPALSGLASFLSQRLQTRYFAGLWEDTLAVDLLWQRARYDTLGLCSRDTQSGIPSWSWASIVRVHASAETIDRYSHIRQSSLYFIKDSRLDFIHADCQVIGSNPFGQVSGGMITISGACISVSLYLKAGSPWAQSRSRVFFRRGTGLVTKPSLEWNTVELDILWPDEPSEVVDGDILSCVLIGKEEPVMNDRGYAVVLKGIEADIYRRVGILRLYPVKMEWWDGVMPTTVRVI